jgi:hypothetical protein
MLFFAPILAALLLFPQAGASPDETRGLHILWVPSAMTELSKEAPGFKVLDPITQVENTFPKAGDLVPILDTLPIRMKENGIWISTSNSFLYVAEEERQLKVLADLAGARGINLFICELGKQPGGWKKVGAP